MTTTLLEANSIRSLLGKEGENLLTYKAKVSQDLLHLPGTDFIDRVWLNSDRSPQVLRNLQQLYSHGRLANTGYLSILPVDQGIEHSAGASFAPNPIYFDPENIIKLAIAGGCNAVATTLGVLGSVSRKYAHKIPFIAKINHNELLTFPNQYDQILFADVEQAWNLGAVAVGAEGAAVAAAAAAAAVAAAAAAAGAARGGTRDPVGAARGPVEDKAGDEGGGLAGGATARRPVGASGPVPARRVISPRAA